MKELTKALLNAQKEFPVIGKDANNPFFKSKYADLASILKVVVPILNKYGIVLMQNPIDVADRIGVTTTLMHGETGENLSYSFTLPLAKNDPQGAGSAITYARRYAIVSILGLNVDEDDDGNEASGNVAKPKSYPKPQPTSVDKAVAYLAKITIPEEREKETQRLLSSDKYTESQKKQILNEVMDVQM